MFQLNWNGNLNSAISKIKYYKLSISIATNFFIGRYDEPILIPPRRTWAARKKHFHFQRGQSTIVIAVMLHEENS